MFIPGRLHQPLANIDDRDWQHILDRHPFLKSTGYSVDDEHMELAFHILMLEGELASDYDSGQLAIEFDSVPIPRDAFLDPHFCRQTWSWQEMHARNYGSGVLTKMGLYVIRSGGSVGFHIDGPVLLKGMKVDMSNPDIQRALLEMQASHRTVLPLRFNPEDQFMICNFRVPMRKGELFEFSNSVPHAYFNCGPEDAILLVTTYLSDDCLPLEIDYKAQVDVPR